MAALKSAQRVAEAKRFADTIIDDPEYRKNLKARALAGILPAAVENTLLFYSKGKPTDHVDVSVTETRVDLSTMTKEELMARTQQILDGIRALEAEKTNQSELLEDQSLVRNPLPFDHNVH